MTTNEVCKKLRYSILGNELYVRNIKRWCCFFYERVPSSISCNLCVRKVNIKKMFKKIDKIFIDDPKLKISIKKEVIYYLLK